MKERKLVISVICAGLISEIINLLYIVYVSETRNYYGNSNCVNWKQVIISCVFFLTILAGSQLMRGVLSARFKFKTNVSEKKKILDNLKNKEKDQLNDLGETLIIFAMEKADSYSEYLMLYNALVVSCIILVTSCTFVAAYISVWYLAGVIILIFIMLVSMLISSPLERKRSIINENQKHNIALMNNMLHSIYIIKSYYMEKAIKKRFHASIEELAKNKLKEKDYELLIYMYRQVIQCGLMVAVPTFTAFLVSKGIARESDIMVAMYGFFFILNHIMTCMAAFENLGKGRGDIQSLKAISNIKDEHLIKIAYPKQSIWYKGIFCSYKDNLIIENKEVRLIPNKINVIWGESGVGKTTFLKCMTGNKLFDKGELILDEEPAELNSLKALITYAPQYPVIFELSPYENILTCNKYVTIQEIQKLLFEISPNLVDVFNLCMNAKKLSGGQKQIISLLRCLLSNKEIVILDEPTASINSNLSRNILEIIKRMAVTKTFVIVTHDSVFFDENANIIYF